MELGSLSVGLGGCSRLHIASLCVSGSEADSKLLLNSENGWHPSFFGMGGGGSKDNVVADNVDYSTNLSKNYAVLRLHGGTSALFAGVAASAVLFYMAYRLFSWKRTKMNQARQRAPQGEGRSVWANPGRVDVEEGEVQGRVARRPPVAFRPPQPVAKLPRPVHEEFCEECREEAAGYDVLRGHFQPLPPLV